MIKTNAIHFKYEPLSRIKKQCPRFRWWRPFCLSSLFCCVLSCLCPFCILCQLLTESLDCLVCSVVFCPVCVRSVTCANCWLSLWIVYFVLLCFVLFVSVLYIVPTVDWVSGLSSLFCLVCFVLFVSVLYPVPTVDWASGLPILDCPNVYSNIYIILKDSWNTHNISHELEHVRTM